jgi:hypothetical protein
VIKTFIAFLGDNSPKRVTASLVGGSWAALARLSFYQFWFGKSWTWHCAAWPLGGAKVALWRLCRFGRLRRHFLADRLPNNSSTFFTSTSKIAAISAKSLLESQSPASPLFIRFARKNLWDRRPVFSANLRQPSPRPRFLKEFEP